MFKFTNEVLINKLLGVIDLMDNNEESKEVDLGIEIHNLSDASVYKLVTRGSRHKNTPFESGSLMTHIVKEDYCDNELVFASILYSN